MKTQSNIKIFISCYNRSEYLELSLNSLSKTLKQKLPEVVITDDCSTDTRVKSVIECFDRDYQGQVHTIFNKTNRGLNHGPPEAIKQQIQPEFYQEPYFFICDSDMIYKDGWLEKLESLYFFTGSPLVTGFNTPSHKILETHQDYYVKESVGGCNILVDSNFYFQFGIQEARCWDWSICDNVKSVNKQVVCTRPSYSQHIGADGENAGKLDITGQNRKHDQSLDF